jgi:hypothetical protein
MVVSDIPNSFHAKSSDMFWLVVGGLEDEFYFP